jgi:tetratricopeptide (TPR) repeat protein
MSASIAVLLIIYSVTAIAQNKDDGYDSTPCLELNQAAMKQAASGRLADAEALLPTATAAGDERGESICAGHVLSNIARLMAVTGRTAEAERLAEQSVRILEKFYPPNDWVLLRPLQILADVRVESGQTARAREAVKRMQSIQIKGPVDSAIVHATVGTLRLIEGRRSEAEAEYHDTIRVLEEAGRSESADVLAIFQFLATLYLDEQRLDEARRALDRALAVYNLAKDAVPFDLIKLLDLRGVLHARLGEWQQSEQDLCDALSMIDRQPSIDPFLLRSLLGNYSYVLRRNHHRREARSIEARKAALPTNGATAAVVDLTDLLVGKRTVKN